MPLKLSVGLSKKVGQPDYGSIGAACGVEVELDQALLRDDLDGFHERVKDAFVACQQAINDELARLQTPPGTRPAVAPNGHAGPGAGAPTSPPRAARSRLSATENQARAIRALARRAGVDLGEILGAEFTVERPEDLSRSDASALIDRLKATADA